MSNLPDYSTCTVLDGDQFKHAVKWRGKIDPIAVCDDARDAQRICDALNNSPRISCGPAHGDWIPVGNELPDDDLEVLVLMKSEKIHCAVHLDGHWYTADQQVGSRLSSAHVTHWCDPVYPENPVKKEKEQPA